MNKLTTRERNLLYVFFALVILFGSYQFGYVSFSNKTESLQKENKELTDTYNELLVKVEKKDKYIKETDKLKNMSGLIYDRFPTNMSQEKSIMFLTKLEDYADIKINSITFSEVTKFYNSDNSSDQLAEEALSDEDQVEEEKNLVITDSKDSLVGYKANMTISYEATYKALKNCIKYINENSEKMNVSSLTAAFDSSTGNLTGTIGINTYAISSKLNNFEDIEIPGIEVGKDNIFGTMQSPYNQ